MPIQQRNSPSQGTCKAVPARCTCTCVAGCARCADSRPPLYGRTRALPSGGEASRAAPVS
eukprot:2767633-Prymnesium_polylepis.1